MTAKHPPAPRGSIEVLTRGGTRRHDAFIGSKRTVCGGLVTKAATLRHRERIGLCRTCLSFRRNTAS